MLRPEWLASAEAASAASTQRAVLDEISATPGFRNLMRPWVEAWRVQAGDNAMISRALRDLGHLLSGVWALHLHATAGGFTLARLSALLASSGVSSPGRARSILALLLFSGYVRPSTDAADRKRHLYVPTQRMTEAFRERYSRDLRVLAPAHPAIRELAGKFHRPELFDAYMANYGEVVSLSFRRYSPGAVSLDVFSHRFSGMQVLAELLLAADPAGPFPSLEPQPVTVAGLAKACHISRVQVRRMLGAAEQMGLLEILPSGGARIMPLMIEHLDMFLAGSLLGAAYAAQAVTAAEAG